MYTYTMEYYSVMRKKEILPFVTMWMEFEGIMPNERSQTRERQYCMMSLVCGETKKAGLGEAESRMMVTRVLVYKSWEDDGQRVQR